MTSIEHFSSPCVHPKIFPLTPRIVDHRGISVRIWSGPGSRPIATLVQSDGTIRSITPIQIRNALNPKEDPVTLHNRLLLAPDGVSWDFVSQADGSILIWPQLKAAGWEEALPKRDQSLPGLTRLARGRSQEQMCGWFYANGYHVTKVKNEAKIEIQLEGNHAGTYNVSDHETIRNLLRQGGSIKAVHHPSPRQLQIQKGFIGRGIVFQHPNDKNQNTFNIDFTREFRNGRWDREEEGGYHIDVRGPHLQKKVRVSTQETYYANRRARQSGDLIRYIIRTSAFAATILSNSLFGTSTPASKQFQQTLQQTQLTDSYNSVHPRNPVPSKGGTGREIGGVACSTDCLEGLFDSPESLFESEHVFVFPNLPEGKMPFTNNELRQIIRELAIGIYVHSTVPFFSLHFNQNLDQFPVIHPAYEHTLVGRVIGMLDYIMKGYLNGGVFHENFIDEWHQDPNWNRKKASSLQNLIDFEEYCKHQLEGIDRKHLSFGDLKFNIDKLGREGILEPLEQTLKSNCPNDWKKLKQLIDTAFEQPEESEILKDFSEFRNSFRIISKLNKVHKEGNILLIDADFDVEYTIQPSPTYQEALNQYMRKHGSLPLSYQILMQTAQSMGNRIHDHMVKLPLCNEYFSMLQVITGISNYFTTLKNHRKIPLLPSMEIAEPKQCPPLFPHLPVKTPKEEDLKISPKEVFEKVLNHPQKALKTYLKALIDYKKKRDGFLSQEDGGQAEKRQAVENAFKAAIEENSLESCSPPLKRFMLGKLERCQEIIEREANTFFEIIENSLKEFLSKAISTDHLQLSDSDELVSDFVQGIEVTDQSVPIVSIKYRIQRLISEVLRHEGDTLRGVVGGCGLYLEKTRVTSSAQASAFLRKNWAKIMTIIPETWHAAINPNPNFSHGAMFRLPFTDLPLEFSEDYRWMESVLLTKDTPEQLEKSLRIQEALLAGRKREFEKLIENENGLAQIKDRNQRGLMHLAALKKDPFYVKALERKGVPLNERDIHGYLPIHYAAMTGAVEIIHYFEKDLEAASNNLSTPFIVAVQHEQLEAVRYFVRKQAKITTITGGYNTLHCALHTENVDLVYELLSHPKIQDHVNTKSEEGGTPLMLACELDSVDLVEALIQKGADPAVARKDGVTAIEIAMIRNCGPVVKHLLQHTPLTGHAIERAMQESSVEIIDLIEKNADFYRHRNACKDTALHTAVRKKNLPAALYIAKTCTDLDYLNEKNIENDTALSLSASLGICEIVKILIEKGLPYDRESLLKMPFDPFLKQLFAPLVFSQEQLQQDLFVALQAGNYRVIEEILMPKGANLHEFEGSNGWSLLHYMAKFDGVYLFKTYLPRDTDFLHRLPREGNKTLAYLAAENRSYRVFLFLAKTMHKRGISFARHYRDQHLFYPVIVSGDLRHCQLMLDLQKNFANEELDEYGTTPAHLAARYGHLEILKELKKEEANLTKEDNMGRTPFDYAVRAGAEKIVAFFLENNVPVTGKTLYAAARQKNKGIFSLLCQKNPEEHHLRCALMDAIRSHDTQAFQLLHPLLPSLSFTHFDGRTPLLLACQTGQGEILAEILKKEGKDHHAVRGNGALHLAASRGHAHCVSLLLQAGYQDCLNDDGKTAADLAGRHRGISRQLKGEGVKNDELAAAFWLAAQKENVDVDALSACLKDLPPNETIFIPALSYWGTPLQVLLFAGKGQKLFSLISQLLQDHNLNFDQVDSQGNTFGHLLAKEGMFLKKISENNLMTRNFQGQTPLHLAAAHAPPSTLKEYLRAIASLVGETRVNFRDHEESTPIFEAIRENKKQNIQLLIEHGADLACYNQRIQTPLICAIETGKLSLVKLLLEAGASPNQPGTLDFLFPLHLVTRDKLNKEFVNTLIIHGANCAKATKEGKDAAHFAAAAGDLSLLRLLAAREHSLYRPDKKGFLPLHGATTGNTKVLSALVSSRRDLIDAPVKLKENEEPEKEKETITSGVTPLHLATLSGEQEAVKCLLDMHANPEATTKNGLGCLSFAALSPATKSSMEIFFRYTFSTDSDHLIEAAKIAIQHDNLDALIALYNRGIPIETELREGGSAGLHIASESGALLCTQWLLQQGEDPYRKNDEGETPLELAAANNSHEQFAFLLQNVEGACDYQNMKGETLLHIAAKEGNLKHTLLLMLHGAPVDMSDIREYTPLHWAAKNGYPQIVKLLLICGLTIEKQTPDSTNPLDLARDAITIQAFEDFQLMRKDAEEGDTALHLAVRDHNPLAVLFLAQTDLINKQNHAGTTPLHLAVQLHQEEIVRSLLRNGADVSITDHQQRLPDSYAQEDSIKALFETLREEKGGGIL